MLVDYREVALPAPAQAIFRRRLNSHLAITMSPDDTPHERDVELAKEDADGEDEEGLTEEEQEARKRQQEAENKADIEHESTEREADALEQENPNHHRDEEPYNS